MTKNRLAAARSPYLRQHEHNPVDWYEWGDEALERARREDKPILLSIGYSACHWCHVMAHESFEDPTIAAQMNSDFVNIKVDREERPDLDQIYQLAVQVMGRSGGWPLTTFLLPDQRPFFVGTYFPPADRFGVPGFPRILSAVAEAYRERRRELEAQAGDLTEAIGRVAASHTAPGPLEPDLLARAAAAARARFDPRHGGFGKRPKFPNSMAVELLLRGGASEEVRLTLDRMRNGGVFDQLGGGFHRYSTDERWLVPHFEKMLYDNALLMRLFADAARALAEPRWLVVAREIAAFIASEMTAADGAFFSTLDADSVPLEEPSHTPVEGAFFVFTEAQVREALAGDEYLELTLQVLGVSAHGNFEDPHYQVPGRCVLSLRPELLTDAASTAAIAANMERLRQLRAGRPRPFRDEKVLTAWNALTISGLSALGDEESARAATRAFDAIVARHLTPGGLLRTSGVPGFLDDHAYLANAALDLAALSSRPRYLAHARALVEVARDKFGDEARGGFFFTARDGEPLVHRPKDPWDQAIPSAQAELARAMLRLAAIDGDPTLVEAAKRALGPLAAAACENPLGLSQTVIVLDRLVNGSTDVVIVGPRDDPRTAALARVVQETWVPHLTLLAHDPSDPEPPPLARGKQAAVPSAWVCRGQTCSPPVSTPAELRALL